MSNVGIILDLGTIRKLRHDFQELSENLRLELKATDDRIAEVSQTWKDENFKSFCNKFETDKQRLMPLSKKISDFDELFLKRIERALIKYNSNK
mgnify:CR=1 FL=1